MIIDIRSYWPELKKKNRGRRGCDGMVGGFTVTYAISAYHH
jgi:hypothetical protein